MSDRTHLLAALRKAAHRLSAAEAQTKLLREERDTLILRACEAGASEREAAVAAGVSATYAHRAKADRGKPRSGPALDAARQARRTGRAAGRG